MKVVFLDFDGVLNGYIYGGGQSGLKTGLREIAPRLNPKLVEELNVLVEKSGAKIVLSTSWRHEYTLQDFQHMLEQVGFKGEVIDRTPKRTRYPARRGNEIEDWLAAHPDVKQFVILDDDGDLAPYMEKLVRTNDMYGLRPEDVTRALTILEQP